ncbi:NADH-quinone oxidoreductase subunit C [Anaeroselena agilis]|uniref:NADH-quinone oxidoreductase subunit C n=1 Tax=Anaeroselena agilis TaxID=3063788 RepID=A0ABU3P3I9_9FIRM|nr:NADH-quinone oxidoreductase subunit C [Selenomonadales bacterium 4137-cl]
MMIKTFVVKAENLRAAANACASRSRHGLLAMFACDERISTGSYAIYCLFDGRKPDGLVTVKGLVPAEGPLEFPSLTPVIPAAAWYEREIFDMFGIKPTDHPELRPLVLHENWPSGLHPLRKDFDPAREVPEADKPFPMLHAHGEGVFEVPVGPIHAGIIEPGHFRFSQAGETILRLDAKLFFTHRGIEKAVEGLTPDEAFPMVERICGVCSVSHALSFSQALEGLTGTSIPERAKWIRVLTAELERLYNHVGDIGNLSAGMGFQVAVSNGARLKESLLRLNEAVTGNRYLRGMVVPGGVAMDVTGKLCREIGAALERFEPDFASLVGLMRENDAFLNRVDTTGIVPFAAARDLGVVGPAARASGVDWDMRRDKPYGGYGELDFAVPVRHSGDVAARLWVRVDEVPQTVRLIRQALERLGAAGPELAAAVPPAPAWGAGAGWSESARGANLHWLMMDDDNRIWRYFVRSASYPNWPALTVAAPGNIIPDFPLINKSFELCYACLDR